MNFRHGSTYLSPSQSTAVRYAVSNSHGSEVLSICIDLISRLRRINPSLLRPIEIEYKELLALGKLSPYPILIKIDQLDVISLLTEQGEDPHYQISRINGSDGALREALLQQSNFELRDCISSDRLKISRIVNWKLEGFDIAYSLEPYVDA